MSTETTHATNGVTLRKYYDETEYNLPSVVYRFSSDRSEPVSVRVVDAITDEIEPEHIGFRKADARDEWTVRDSELVFECALEPTDTYETVCAIRPEASYDEDALVTDPVTFEVDTLGSETEQAGVTGSAGGADTATAIDRSALSVADNGTGLGSMEEIEIGSLREKGTTNGNEGRTDGDSSVVDQLAADLRQGRGSATNREYLASTLGAPGDSNSTEARIRQIQSDLSDFRAYTAALEEFIDENGSAGTMIDEFEGRLDTFEQEVTSVQSVVDEQADAISAVRSDLDGMEQRLDAMDSQLTSLAESVDGLRGELSTLDGQLPDGDLDERLTTIESDVEELSGFMADLKHVFGSDGM